LAIRSTPRALHKGTAPLVMLKVWWFWKHRNILIRSSIFGWCWSGWPPGHDPRCGLGLVGWVVWWVLTHPESMYIFVQNSLCLSLHRNANFCVFAKKGHNFEDTSWSPPCDYYCVLCPFLTCCVKLYCIYFMHAI
jgi:hypothetical protein